VSLATLLQNAMMCMHSPPQALPSVHVHTLAWLAGTEQGLYLGVRSFVHLIERCVAVVVGQPLALVCQSQQQ
jgi:hypothetical protein